MSSEVMSVLARLEGDAASFMRAFDQGISSLKSLDAAVDSTASSVDSSMQEAGKSFDMLGEEADQAGQEVGSSAEDAADKTEKSSDRMSKGLKIAGAAFAALGAAAVAGAAALTAASLSAAHYADDILKAEAVTGQSTETLQVFKYGAEQLDVSFDTMQGSLAKMARSMANAGDATSGAGAAFAKLGISTTNADGSLRDANEVYWEAMDALGAMSNETERTALSMELFGRSGAELAPLMEAGSAGFAEMAAQAENAGAIMSGPALAALGEFDDSMKQLQATTDATKNAIGLTLMPVLDALAGEGASAFGELNKALLDANGDLSKAAPAFGDFAEKIISGLGDAVPMVLDLGTELVMGLVSGLSSAVPEIAKAVPPMIESLVGGILAMLPTILNAGVLAVTAIATGLAKQLPTLIPTLVSGLLDAVDALLDNLPMLLDAGLQLVQGLAEGILDALPELIDRLPEIILGIVDFVIGSIPMIVQAGVDLFIALVQALPDIITGVVAAIPKIIDGVLSAVLDALPLLIEAGVELFIALVENLPLIVSTIVGSIPTIITGIVTAIANSIPKMVSVGADLLRGLWTGISSVGDWIWRQIKGFFGGIVDAIKGLLGIHSPSTVFADIGKNVGIGYAEGIEDSTRDVQKAMDAMTAIPSPDAMSLSFGPVNGVQYVGSNPAAMGGGEKIVVKQDFHLYSPTSADPLESTKEAAGLMRTGLALAGIGIN